MSFIASSKRLRWTVRCAASLCTGASGTQASGIDRIGLWACHSASFQPRDQAVRAEAVRATRQLGVVRESEVKCCALR